MHGNRRSTTRSGIASGAPSLTTIAEVIHQGSADNSCDQVVFAACTNEALEVAIWAIDPSLQPTSVLVGWSPPGWAHQLGLVTHGRAHTSSGSEPVRVTVLMDRGGAAVTILESESGEVQTITEPPQGWGANVLRRCLGLPTAAPDQPVGYTLECAWLCEIVAMLATSSAKPRVLSWADLALLHPLNAGPGPVQPGDLALATECLREDHGWMHLLNSVHGLRPPMNPPGGSTVALAQWFDPGTICSWYRREYCDFADVLSDVLSDLPGPVADDLLSALTTIS